MRSEHPPGARGARPEEDGFTLLELMMVILIIAILIAVLIPTFLGAQTRAKDRAAQSSLSTALTAAKSLYTSTLDYGQATNALLAHEAGALTFVGSGVDPGSSSTVSVLQAPAGVATQIILSGVSKSGTCFYVLDDEAGVTQYASSPSVLGCRATTAPIPGDAAWKPKW